MLSSPPTKKSNSAKYQLKYNLKQQLRKTYILFFSEVHSSHFDINLCQIA